jgi:hypothetical protein
MLLAGVDVEGAKRLIDRGVRSDERWPEGKAYLMNTSDGSRNVRAQAYEQVRATLGAAYPIEQVDADALEGRTDVMFEFTGVARVASLAANRFVDGAIADHLTSFGGILGIGGNQTSALDWLAAGATGSYGTSSEPCNFRAKFPEVGIVMARYLAGEALVEAYWKSVAMPGQGVFVGDPLARPFGGVRVGRSAAGTLISTRALPPGDYLLEAGPGSVGPFRPIRALRMLGFGVRQLTLPAGDARWFRLRAIALRRGPCPRLRRRCRRRPRRRPPLARRGHEALHRQHDDDEAEPEQVGDAARVGERDAGDDQHARARSRWRGAAPSPGSRRRSRRCRAPRSASPGAIESQLAAASALVEPIRSRPWPDLSSTNMNGRRNAGTVYFQHCSVVLYGSPPVIAAAAKGESAVGGDTSESTA